MKEILILTRKDCLKMFLKIPIDELLISNFKVSVRQIQKAKFIGFYENNQRKIFKDR